MHALTQDEILAVLKEVSDSPRDAAMFCAAFRHGLRASEICNLTLDDLDVKNAQIRIKRLKGSLTTTQAIVDHPGQPLLSELRLLRTWLAKRNDASNYLFTSKKGGRLSRVQIYRLFRSAASRARLPVEKRHPHCLKHSLAFSLISQNVHILHVKQHLGHRSLASTMHYMQPDPSQTTLLVNRALADKF